MKVKNAVMMMSMVLLAGALFTGCNGPDGNKIDAKSEPAAADNPVSVSVVAGVHSNANVISVNAKEINDWVYQCAYTYGTVSLIRADGKPEEFLKTNIGEPETKGLSESKLKSIAEGYRDEILATFNTNGMAVYEEVDTLEAIRLAGNSLKTVEEGDRYLVIADTGLSTTGYLNFCKDDLFNTPTEEIISALADEKAIPDLNGVEVVWLYAGQTAEPQGRLSEVQKDKLIEIWSAVLEEAGAASYEFCPDSASSTAYTGLPEVSVVDVDERGIDVPPLKTMILDSESVTFDGDLATFVDPGRAEEAISSVAQTLLDNPDNKVYVVGCTASAPGREDFCRALSEDRAQAVVNVLKKCDVPDDQMIAVGLGDDAPWHVPDLDDSGHQIEEYARQNRQVVVLDSLDPEYGAVVGTYIE